MTTPTAITILVAKLAAKIEWAMTEMEMTYSEAKAMVAASSVAGVAVWAALDERFA